MKFYWKIILCVIPLFLVELARAQGSSPQKVLFVGNSYTYFWNLPQHVASMAESQDIPLETRQSTAGGSNLGQHWKGEKALNSRNIIQEGDYDAVVLQDYSLRALKASDSLMYYGQLFGELIRKSGAQAFLYLTWAREYDPYMQKTITDKYTELAKKINARLVPVGLAFERSRQLRPQLNLYDPDGSHPSPYGTYLSACVFYGAFTQKTPVGLPNRLISQDKAGEKLYLNILPSNDARFLQKVAEEVLLKISE